MPKPERGRIVLVELPDPQGKNVKSRPVVIVHVDKDEIVGVAISGKQRRKRGYVCFSHGTRKETS
jgi:hypothetical protein